jgi:hypothetical protein
MGADNYSLIGSLGVHDESGGVRTVCTLSRTNRITTKDTKYHEGLGFISLPQRY